MTNQNYAQENNLVSKRDSENIKAKNNNLRLLDLKEMLEIKKEVNLILKIKKEVEARELEKKSENLNNRN